MEFRLLRFPPKTGKVLFEKCTRATLMARQAQHEYIYVDNVCVHMLP